MPTILNSFTLPDSIIKKMKDQIEKTRNTNIEHGFNICKYNGGIIDKDECTGNSCEIRIKRECSNQDITPKVGDYHTHPRGGPKMSLLDMRTACHFDFKCIGAIDNSIKCFVKKSGQSPEECSVEIEKVVIGTEKMDIETSMLNETSSILDELKKISNRNMDRYWELIREYNKMVRTHNERVSHLSKRKDMIRDMYFKEITIK